MASKDTIQKDLGVSIRDRIRLDVVILAFNSGVEAKEWIFFGRPQDLNKKLVTPKIIVEPIDEIRDPYSIDKKQDLLIPYLFHVWMNKADSDALGAYEMADRLKKIGSDLDDDPDNQGIWEAEVTSFSITPENDDTKEIDHLVVRVQVVWRENLA